MIDYGTYELTNRQKCLFLGGAYVCIFIITFLFFHSVPLSLLCGFAGRLLLPRYREELARVRREKLNRQFKDMLYSLSSSLSCGRQMEEALVEAQENLSCIYKEDEPICVELTHMKKAVQENNESDRSLLEDFAERSCCQDINGFVQVYLTCRNTGGDLEQIISHTTRIMTEKMEIKEQINVLMAQKKLEGRIISAMPFAMLLAMNLLSPGYVAALYTGIPGRITMALCLGITIAGILLMERLTEWRF